MSLTQSDLQEIRTVVESVFEAKFQPAISALQNEVQALRNDIKEIYDMIADMNTQLTPDKKFAKMSEEQQILTMHREIHLMAKNAGVSLPKL